MKVASRAVGLLWLALCASALGKDVLLYSVSKGIHYQQTLSAPPTVLTENGYVFEAHAFLPLAGTVTSAMVESTEGTDRILALEGDDTFEFRNRVNSSNTLSTRYPDGPFTFTINAVHDGRKVISLPLAGNMYPAAPNVANLPELQSVNANGYIVVRWDAFSGGTAQDYIQLRIEESDGDRAFETRDFGQAGALDGTATYTVIEPGRLKPGVTYEATLRFAKTSAHDTTSYPGAPGWSAYHALTRFTMITTPAAAADLKSYKITKGRRFEQTSAGPPVLDLNDEFAFEAEVKFSAADSVLSAVVSWPEAEPVLLGAESTEAKFSTEGANQEWLDANFPNGTYYFTIEGASQGVRSMPLTISGNAYPPVPHLSNFNPAQPVRADQNLILEWDQWAGGSANDLVQLRIEDSDGKKIFETSDLGEPGSLKGGATWALVPAGTLEPGETYKGRLIFTRVVTLDNSSYPGALGIASYYTRTKFNIVTGPPDVTGFRITKGREYKQTGPATLVPGGSYTFSASVSAASTGVVESVVMNVPGRGPVPLPLQEDGQTFALSEVHNSQESLNAAFPNGTYQLVMRGLNDGLRTLNMDLMAEGYPNPPVINDYEGTGQIFPWFDWRISWAPFEGGRSRDFILMEIFDSLGATVYRTGDYRQEGSMGGVSTEVSIFAESLQPNALYSGHLMFERINAVEDPAYPNVAGRTSFFTSTRWPLATLGTGNPPNFTEWSLSSDGRLELVFPTIIGGTYVIEGSRDLVTWEQVTTISAADEQSTFSVQPDQPHYFYRLIFMR
jgi:hypothetical protein